MKYYCPSCKLDNLPKGNGLCVCNDVELLLMAEPYHDKSPDRIVSIKPDDCRNSGC